MFSWLSRKHSSVSLSAAEVEYIAACSTNCETIWLQMLLSYLFYLDMDAIMILCDNQSFMKMTENPMFRDKMKHIDIWYFTFVTWCRKEI